MTLQAFRSLKSGYLPSARSSNFRSSEPEEVNMVCIITTLQRICGMVDSGVDGKFQLNLEKIDGGKCSSAKESLLLIE